MNVVSFVILLALPPNISQLSLGTTRRYFHLLKVPEVKLLQHSIPTRS